MSRFAFAAVLGVTAMASADFVGASYTEEVINPGEVTYKIFLNYDNPLDSSSLSPATPTSPRCN